MGQKSLTVFTFLFRVVNYSRRGEEKGSGNKL